MVIDAGSNEVCASTSTCTASVSTVAFQMLAFQAFGAHHFNAVNGAPVHLAPRPSLNVNSGGGGSLEMPVGLRGWWYGTMAKGWEPFHSTRLPMKSAHQISSPPAFGS